MWLSYLSYRHIFYQKFCFFIFLPTQGDPVWFEPPETDEHFPEGLLVPGIVTDYNEASELATIESLEAVDGKQLFHVQNSTTGVLRRTDFVAEDGGQEAGGKAVVATVEDMVRLGDLHQSSIFWNIYKRYEQQQIYVSRDIDTFC